MTKRLQRLGTQQRRSCDDVVRYARACFAAREMCTQESTLELGHSAVEVERDGLAGALTVADASPHTPSDDIGQR